VGEDGFDTAGPSLLAIIFTDPQQCSQVSFPMLKTRFKR